MSDETPFYTPNLKRAPLSVGQPAVEEQQFRFELRGHGEQLGVEGSASV
jgi:hypothetical protein